MLRTNLVNGTNWGVKKCIFSAGRTRKGRQIHRDIKSDPVALTNSYLTTELFTFSSQVSDFVLHYITFNSVVLFLSSS